MLGMILATLAILGSQLLVIAPLIGLGLWLRRGFGVGIGSIRDVLVAFWVGLAATLLFLILWNFLFRVSAAPLALVAVAGFAGLWRSRLELRALPGRESWWARPAVLALLVLAALYVANLGRGPLANTDTLLYHLQGVQWAVAYPAVPGLANLFGPLGFNNASLLYDAMLQVGPWAGRAHHIASGVLIQVLGAHALLGIVALLAGPVADRAAWLFDAVLVVPAADMAMQDWLRSYVTGLPATSVALIAASETHHFLLDRQEESTARVYHLATALILIALAVIFKISIAVLGALTTLLLLAALFRERAILPRLRWRAATWGLLGMAAIGVSWAARGVVLSGYPLFPMTLLPAPVEWRVPVEHAIAEYGYAAESARASVSVTAGVLHEEPFGVWFERWWSLSGSEGPHQIVVPLAFSVALALAIAGLLVAGRRDRSPAPWLLLGPTVVALVAWFLMAPEPRYAMAAGYIMLATLASGLYRLSDREGGRAGLGRQAALAVALLGVSPLIVRPLVTPGADRRLPPLRRLIESNLRYNGPGSGFYAMPQLPEVTRYRTASGLELNTVFRRCRHTPIPCTPNPAPNLRLRVPGRLDKGFVVDGEWQMENWPAGRPDFGRDWAERRRRERAAEGS